MNKICRSILLFIVVICFLLIVSCKKEVNKHTIKFITNGGSQISDLLVEDGKKIDNLVKPTHRSNTFMGWYVDSNFTTSFDQNSTITSDVTLYAKWERILNIYTVNDFHGAIEDKSSQVGEYIISNKNRVPESTIVLSAGDMFQGSGRSNYSKGRDMINIMNMIGFDAMTVGNHEFDWELNTILNYFNGNQDDGEAEFPILGCNVIDKTTGKIPNYMKSYEIIEKDNLKVGVIGYIGSTLEDSIAVDKVKNYDFVDPIEIIKEISIDLRTNHDVDIVIASGHDATAQLNNSIANISGDGEIDVIVNGHSHSRSQGTITRLSDGAKVPYVQAGSSGEAVGTINLTLNDDNSIRNVKVFNKMIMNTSTENKEISSYVDELIKSTAHYFDKEIGIAGRTLYQSTGAEWACNAMLDYALNEYGVCDIAMTNIGGIRDDAFPINKGDSVTINTIFKMMPFDNTIILTSIKGNILRNLISSSNELAYSTNSVTKEGSTIKINGIVLNDDLYYRVAIVDYIFEQASYPFMDGEDIIITGKLIRDVLIENIENDTKNGDNCF